MRRFRSLRTDAGVVPRNPETITHGTEKMTTTLQPQTQLIPPNKPGEWSLDQIKAALSRPLPASVLEYKSLKGNSIPYLPWHVLIKSWINMPLVGPGRSVRWVKAASAYF